MQRRELITFQPLSYESSGLKSQTNPQIMAAGSKNVLVIGKGFLLPSSDRSRKSVKRFPSVTKPVFNDCSWNFVKLAPFNKAFCFAVNCYQTILARVSGLFFWRCPLNISFFVMPVSVFAVKRMLWRRATSNFFQKFFKGSKFKLNTTPPINFILRAVSVITTVFRAFINTIFRRRFAVLTFAVSQRVLFSLTSTRAIAFQQLSGLNNKLSANTSAKPHNTTPFIATVNRINSQVTKLLACKIFEVVGLWNKRVKTYVRIQFRHFNLLNRLECLGVQECS